MHALLLDLRYALVLLRRAPGFAATALLTLALGVGAATTVFSLVRAVLVRSLPYAEPDRLVMIVDGHEREKSLSKVFASYQDFEIWKAHSTTVEAIGVLTWATGQQILTGQGPARFVLALPVSVELFSLLGVPAALGRTFQPDDLGRGCSVVLSHKFWQNAQGGRSDAVGRSLTLDDRACIVVGVMPASFEFYPVAADMWSLILPGGKGLDAGVGVFARLRPGVRVEAAQSELAALHRSDRGADAHAAMFSPRVSRLQDEFTWLTGRNLRLTLLVLFAAVGFVLLIACVNVANVLLARSIGRQREFAVRGALGSGRWRLVRQLLTEGLLLSVLGAGLGVLLAVGAVHAFRTLAPVELPPGGEVRVDLGVLAFSAGLSVATTLLVGTIPAWRASRVDITSMLRGAGRGASDSPGRRYFARALVVVEMACSVILLVGAGLLIESITRLAHTPRGFDPSGLQTLSLRLPPTSYTTARERTGFHETLLRTAAATPGVEGAALSLAFVRGRGSNLLSVEGRPEVPLEQAVPDVSNDAVSADYFRVLRVPVLAGRAFSERDDADAPLVAIVNEALARRYFPGDAPVGQRVRYGRDASDPWLTVVGVVGNQKDSSLHDEMSLIETPMLFRPVAQTAPREITLLVRVASAQASVAVLQRQIAAFAPTVPVGDVRALDDELAKDLAQPRFRALLLGGFAALALLLAMLGLYGVLSHLVAQRTQEIGIRMALGASRTSILGMIARQGALIAGLGLVAGLVTASWLGRFMSAMLYGVRPADPGLAALVAIALGLAALLAVWVPARRAVATDPIVALRQE
jgi:putative ABC transport system permease protein